MSKHTPGPWQVGRPTEHGTFSCGIVTRAGEDSSGIAQVLSMPTNGVLEELPDHYAEQIANARLIAAAPELLEALRLALPWIETCPEGEEATRAGFAAIAKATGGAA